MLNLLSAHGKKMLAGLAMVIAIGSGGLTAYQRATSCCHAGASCCYPGSPCCHGQAMAAR
jgi:hypothetical protein